MHTTEDIVPVEAQAFELLEDQKPEDDARRST
jgi:hypothetical protein